MWKTQEVEPSCRPCRLQSLAMQEPCYSEAPGHSYPGSSPLDRQRWAVALVAWVMHHESPSLLSNLLLRLFSCARFFRSGLFCLVHSSLHHNFGLAMNHASFLSSVTCMERIFGAPGSLYQLAAWSSGMILAQGCERGPGLNSQNSPCSCTACGA